MDRLIVPTGAPLKNTRENYQVAMNDRLRVLRKSHNKTLKEMALFLGVAISTYAGYEAKSGSNNQREPDLDKIMRLADYFGVSVDYLIGNTDIRFPYESVSVLDLISNDKNLDKNTKSFLLSQIKKYESPMLEASV